MTFEEVKARLVAEPVLACPDISRTFLLQTDPSEKGKRVISYSIRTLNGAKKKLFNNGEGVLGDRLGDPKALVISGRVPGRSQRSPSQRVDRPGQGASAACGSRARR